MAGNKQLLIFRDKICTDQKYTHKVKWKRSTKLISLKFSGNVYPPVVVVQIDSYSKLNKIHGAHFWVCMVATLGAFINCQIRSDFQMGASTLLHVYKQPTYEIMIDDLLACSDTLLAPKYWTYDHGIRLPLILNFVTL